MTPVITSAVVQATMLLVCQEGSEADPPVTVIRKMATMQVLCRGSAQFTEKRVGEYQQET